MRTFEVQRSVCSGSSRRVWRGGQAAGFAAALCLVMTACGAERGGGASDAGGGTGDGGASAGSDAGGGGLVTIPGLKSIRVEPPTVTVNVSEGMPANVRFKAIGVFEGKPERDITTEVQWRTDNLGRASIDASGLATTASNAGGLVQVTALAGLLRGEAELHIKFTAVLLDDTVATPLPADVADKFEDAPENQALAPKLVYPATGALLPPNLFGVEVHFRPGEAKLFELQLSSDYLDLRVYTRCQKPGGVDGCIYTAAKKVWQILTAANRGGGAVTLTVRGMDEAGNGKGRSESIELLFSRDDLQGAVYYWTTSDGGAIMRWDFGNVMQTEAEVVVKKSAMTGNTCPGCHALNRDGGKLVLSVGGQNDGRMLLLDMKTRMPKVPFPLAQRSQFEAWNPTGTRFVGTYNDEDDVTKNPGYGQLIFFNGDSGAVESMFKPGTFLPNHSDWSPDGKKIVFTTIGEHKTDQKSFRGGIAYVQEMASGWSEPVEMMAQLAGRNRYYPAVSPTSDFIAFNESTCPEGKVKDDGCDFDMDPSSKLWGMYFEGGGSTPVEFANANRPGVEDGASVNITNSYPKWSPFVFQLTEDRRLMWLTFTSRRAYGLRGKRILLWMVGIEPAALAAGKDPSFAAFALPFQDLDSNNHIAQWTSRVPVVE